MRISFCIPTYNHAQYLGASLDAILAQRSPEDEIVIVDGGSQDCTRDVVLSHQGRHHGIIYFRREINVGVDPDIEEAVSRATGDYVWLTSSDDVIPDGTVAAVREELSSGRTIYIGTRRFCTAALEPFGVDRVLNAEDRDAWNIGTDAQTLEYLNAARGLAALFSYISILVIGRNAWDGVGDNRKFHGTCYAHVFRLWAAARSGGSIQFVDRTMAMCRMDTDNFAQRGVYRRFMLDFDGYLRVGDEVFGDSGALNEAFRAAVRREHRVLRLGKFFRSCGSRAERRRAIKTLRTLGYRWSELMAMRLVAAGGPLVAVAVQVRKYTRRSLGKRRALVA